MPKCNITLHAYNTPTTVGPFDVELALPFRETPQPDAPSREEVLDNNERFLSNEYIRCLILTVKAHHTISALEEVKHRLDRNSTVLFLQNGMGTIDDVNRVIWPDEELRPNYMIGVNSHGVYQTGPFEATHAGHGFIYLGILPRAPLADSTASNAAKSKGGKKSEEKFHWHESSRNILQSMTQ